MLRIGDAVVVESAKYEIKHSMRPGFVKEFKHNMVRVQFGDGRYEWIEDKRVFKA